MMKYPIGIQSFNQLIEDGYVYVDKTALVYNLVKNGKIYNPQIQIFAKSETKRPNFWLLHKTKRSKNSERTT